MAPTFLLLERLATLVNQSLRDDAARHGLQPIHLQALAYLAACNRYSDIPIALAEYFGTTRGTVSQTIAVLERKGLITREADPLHGKRIHLRLTRKGRNVLKSSWSQRLEAALEETTGNPADMNASLQALLVALQRQNDNRAFGICRQCAWFRRTGSGAQCGLTGEPLAAAMTTKICREWQQPEAVA
ncbi:MAG TPA: MarR family winged helix-turn-helix transcriptional regulator [Woeseiaceae bacterium]|nr:MarR family winged helix-turn-helix transcriptional regulator [Woeseiaceae bacterium]